MVFVILSSVDQAGATPISLFQGLRLRLTRNLDKTLGFVNGTLGVVP